MYVVYINLLYFLSIFLFTYNKNLLSQKKNPHGKFHNHLENLSNLSPPPPPFNFSTSPKNLSTLAPENLSTPLQKKILNPPPPKKK